MTIKIRAVPKSGCNAVMRNGKDVSARLTINKLDSLHFPLLLSIRVDSSIINANLASSEG